MSGLPGGARVGTVRLQVGDLQRSLAFYRDLIGFRVLGRDDGVARLGAGTPRGPEADGTGGGGTTRGGTGRGGTGRVDGSGSSETGGPILLELVEKPGVRPVPRTGLLGIYHFALLLPTRADLGRFVRHHARRGTPFGAADHAFSEALYLEDPDGITIEVYADRPRSEWPSGNTGSGSGPGDRTSGLPLVSDPLDAAGLMAVAGDQEWEGVPEGSVMGHMHFFVDDLDAADAFYVRGLGFEPMITVPTALFVAAGGYHHHVGLNTWRAGVPTATADDAKLLDWELVLPDGGEVDAVADRLREEGFEPKRVHAAAEHPEAAVEVAGDGVSEAALVAEDPWGIRVRVTG